MRTTSAFQPNGVKNFELASTSLFSDANIVGYWKLTDGNDEISTNDITGTGTSFVSGKFNNAISATGAAGSYATFTSKYSTVWDNPYTLSMWVYASALDSTNSDVLLWPGDRNQQHIISSTGKLTITTFDGTAANVIGNTTLVTGTWYHIVFQRTSSSAGKVYINGVDDTSGTAAMRSVASNPAHDMRLFSRQDATSANFNGTIDDVALFSRALTATEIGYLYSLGTTKAYYPLNGNSRDFSGNTNTGTDTSITYPQGRFGQGAKFNGSSSLIDCGTSSSLGITGAITLSAWVKGNGSGVDRIIWRLGGTGNYGYQLSTTGTTYSPNNAYVMSLVGTGGGTDFAFGTAGQAIDDKWHLVTATYDGTNARGYVDGKFSAISGTLTNYLSNANSLNLYLGRDATTNFFSGIIDEVIIESRAWTAKEVETYYRKSTLNYRKSIFGAIFSYILSVTKATMGITPKNITLAQALKVSKANVSITAKVVNLIFRGWRNVAKNVVSFTSQNKSSASTYTEPTKSSSTWEELNKS